MTPNEALIWLQVIGVLVSTGRVAVGEVEAALRSVRGQTDLDTAAADNEVLAALHAELSARYAQAAQDAQAPAGS